MDALGEILRSLRLETGLVSRAVLSSPWAVHTNGTPWSIFHAILEGSPWVSVEGEPAMQLHPGDLLLLPSGEPHTLSDLPGVPSRHIARLPVVSDGTAVTRLVHGGGGPRTEILCGSFLLRQSSAQSGLTKLLPKLLRITRDEAPLAEWLQINVSMLLPDLDTERPGADAIVSGITDLLFVRVLRTFASRSGSETRGWLSALKDPRVAASLALIHGEPTREWTIEDLARGSGMSRTTFCERFRELVGDTPSHYLASWRMHLACDLLDKHPERSIAEVAQSVGYRSEDAFSRAFRRSQGLSPAAWRRRRAAS